MENHEDITTFICVFSKNHVLDSFCFEIVGFDEATPETRKRVGKCYNLSIPPSSTEPENNSIKFQMH